MRKKLLFSMIILGVLFFSNQKTSACTGFVIYTDTDTFYCMNFDYPNYEIVFNLEDFGVDTVLFSAGFMYNGYPNKYFGYNSMGNFSSFQQLYPDFPTCTTEPNIDIGTAWTYFVGWFSEVDEFNNFLTETNTTVVKADYLPNDYHLLMADKTGNSMVLEPIGTGHELTFINGNFQVMTNFPVYQFQEEEYTEVTGVGAARYINTYEYLEENFESFNFEKCLEAAQVSLQTSGSFKTQSTIIVNPNTNEAFIILNRDFEHIWKASIEERTISTFRGFENQNTINFDDDGISENELLNMLVDVSEDNNIDIKIYPNPTTDILNISGIKAKSTVIISDINGRKLYSAISNKDVEVLNLSNFSSGVYFLEIQDDKSSEFYRFIKK